MPPYKRPKTFKIDMNEVDKLVLEKLSKRHKLSQKEIIGYLVGLCDKYNLMTGDWQGRLEDLDEARERFKRHEGSCPALTYGEKAHWCVWGRDGKPPDKKKLAKDFDEALDFCVSCNKTLEIKMENLSYQAKVQELEAKLKEQSTKKFKIPQCQRGAQLDKDGLNFNGCERQPTSIAVSIAGYCKKIRNGEGCMWFKTQLIAVGTEA